MRLLICLSLVVWVWSGFGLGDFGNQRYAALDSRARAHDPYNDPNFSGYWLARCSQGSEDGACYHLVMGMRHAASYAYEKNKPFITACPDTSNKNQILLGIWMDYLVRNPQTHGENIPVTFYAAMEEVYPPCSLTSRQ